MAMAFVAMFPLMVLFFACRKWLLSMRFDYRTWKVRFAGITMQEYSPASGKLLGQPVRVFRGTGRGSTEGPNIIKKDGWYYLTVAEGGTEFSHCAMVARTKSIWGPYEESPWNPLITSDGQPDCKLARAGHGQIIQGHDGSWYMAHLCARPVDMCSILGRETAIQNIRWTEDGWPRLTANDMAKPAETFDVPREAEQRFDRSQRVDFTGGSIPIDDVTLRQGRGKCGISLQAGMLGVQCSDCQGDGVEARFAFLDCREHIG